MSTSCGGSELLYTKMKRLIKEESGKTPADKKSEVRYCVFHDLNSIYSHDAIIKVDTEG